MSFPERSLDERGLEGRNCGPVYVSRRRWVSENVDNDKFVNDIERLRNTNGGCVNTNRTQAEGVLIPRYSKGSRSWPRVSRTEGVTDQTSSDRVSE